ncbi:MAG: PAS domain S-box protein [Deltaproteobacteria bacterium]|nr:PAS domain S-box protein [Deltaproteobacteria bacterium]
MAEQEATPRREQLRQLARKAAGGARADLEGLSAEDVAALVHELGVYQIELETQNEELRSVQLRLEAARARYQDLYDFAPVGYFTVDAGGRIREANIRGCELLGVERARLLGQPFARFLARESSDAYHLHLTSVLRSRSREVCELRLTAEGGRSFEARLESQAATDAEGRPVCRTALSDVTGQKEAERALGRAKEAAESANRQKSKFLARMSHDIRTPMSGIIGMTELALAEDLPDKAREYLGYVESSGRSLLELINDLLDLARVESGKAELHESDFDLRDSLGSLLSAIGSLATRRGLALRHSVAPEVPRLVRGDRGRLGQVLVNLVGNAVKFTRAGSVGVSVRLDRRQPGAEGGVRLLFEVRDTGGGVPPEKLAAIFEPFEQARRADTVSDGGTGLGLAICKQLVQLMGGRSGPRAKPGRAAPFGSPLSSGSARALARRHSPKAT